MASTITSQQNTTGTGTLTLASDTIPADELGVLFWSGYAFPEPDLPSIGGTQGGTWTNIQDVSFTDGVTAFSRAAAWYYMPSSDATGTVTLTEGSNGWDNAIAEYCTVDEMNTGGSPRGASSVVQSSSDNDDTSNTSIALAGASQLAVFADATNNVCLQACFVYIDGTVPNITLDDSQAFTELGDRSTTSLGFTIGHYTGQDRTPGGSWSSVDAAAVIAMELDNEPGVTNYTMTADAGSYAVTGTAASLEFGGVVAADAASYTVTGTAANLEHHSVVNAEAGTYTVTGADAGLTAAVSMAADGASYTVTGASASLEYGPAIDAEAGAYTVTGADVTLTYSAGYDLAADAGSYTITGTDANFDLIVLGDPGVYTITGSDATLTYTAGHDITADAGSYTVTGSDATLTYGASYSVAADAGSYAVTGSDASLKLGAAIDAGAGSYTVTGADASLLASLVMAANGGAYTVTGADATLTVSGEVFPALRHTLGPDSGFRYLGPDNSTRYIGRS